MHIVIINTSEQTGGAAIAAGRLAKALSKAGLSVKMLVRDKQSDDPGVFPVATGIWGKIVQKIRFYWERLLLFLCNGFDKKQLFTVSIANTGTDLSKNRWIQEADLIHLHWINQGFLSLSDLKKLFQTGKPIVWTMHDMWPCTAICHHARSCVKYQVCCEGCPFLHSKGKDLSTVVFSKKEKMYRNAKICFVGCSNWLAEKAGQSRLLFGKKICAIPNPIDLSLYRPKNKKTARKELSLPEEPFLLLFGALNVSDPRKGAVYLIEALKRNSGKQIELVVFGQVKAELAALLPVKIHYMGYLSDKDKIVSLYNAIDLFVTSSLEENLPNTIMEAMACGTPCVGFQIGGIPEMIDHKRNGYVAAYKDTEDLAAGIDWVLDFPDKRALSAACVEKVKRCYAEEAVAAQYMALYREMIDNPMRSSDRVGR